MAEAHNGKEEPIVVAAAGEGNTEMVLKINGDQDQNQEASQPQQHDEGGGETMGLHEQALLAVLGNYIEKIGPILSLIGLGTIASAIGGYFSRSPLALFTFAFDEDESDVNRKAILVYYMSLLVFIAVGALELGYGIWVSGNPVRAGKVAKAILLLSAIALLVTMNFTGAGVTV